MTNERAVEILKKLIPQPRRGDGKSTTHLMITEALDMAIKALEQRWIPVSKELPEENIHVLCQFYMGGMAECYHEHGVWHIVSGYRISCDEVVAWMPLPDAYKESEDKE